MDTDDDDLSTCMEGMAAGDPAFLFTFHERYGPKVAWIVRDIVRQTGRIDILSNPDEIDGLVLDACEVIFDRAAGWRAGGALPWNWANRAIRSQVAAGIGHRLAEFDTNSDAADRTLLGSGIEGEASFPWAEEADLTGDDLADLARSDPRAQLLDIAMKSVGHRRNQEICWQYGLQKGLGDPSPAITVSQMFEVSPGNARQIFRRQKAMVAQLIDSDDRFELLRDIGWFAA